MRIRIVPYGELRPRLISDGRDFRWLELVDRSNVGDALRALGVELQDRLIVGIDGEYATPDTPLHDGAELVLVTPMEGG
jgi:molybdopterin converting factor small subunit